MLLFVSDTLFFIQWVLVECSILLRLNPFFFAKCLGLILVRVVKGFNFYPNNLRAGP
jgi:hypothetical protein